jgi:hypothetical protein
MSKHDPFFDCPMLWIMLPATFGQPMFDRTTYAPLSSPAPRHPHVHGQGELDSSPFHVHAVRSELLRHFFNALY